VAASSRPIIIAGAGIAGLTAALAFAAKGYAVQIFERAPKLEEAGAGLQLSPNATRILAALGVLDALLPKAVKPEAVVLRDARTLREITRVPLGSAAERRWKSPYLVAHRADLQRALLSRVLSETNIQLVMGAKARHFTTDRHGVVLSVERDGAIDEARGQLLVAADGVWSAIRGLSGEGSSRFAGDVAWRTTFPADSPAGAAFRAIAPTDVVTAFMHPSVHLIAYPVRSGQAINLVALTRGGALENIRREILDPALLRAKLRGTATDIARLAQDAGPWTLWPLHTVDPARPWTSGGRMVLVGDAAHAMTPFAAQGAAMAIEDAATLAAFVSASPDDIPTALAQYETIRRPRIARVSRRGAFNRFTWHAPGLVALARNLVLKTLPAEKLAADLDWLYGWTVPEVLARR
jgi:salicylate hydroxylase